MISTLTSDDIIALGVLIGFSFVLNKLSTDNMKGLLAYMTSISAILVYGGIIDLWIFVLTIILYITMLYKNLNLSSNSKIFLKPNLK